MKKVMSFLAVVALIATVNTSCKKIYTCECCTSCSGTGKTCESVNSGTKLKKKDAQTWCSSGNKSVGTCSTDCNLK